MVEDVRFERRFRTPNAACYHYTTSSRYQMGLVPAANQAYLYLGRCFVLNYPFNLYILYYKIFNFSRIFAILTLVSARSNLIKSYIRPAALRANNSLINSLISLLGLLCLTIGLWSCIIIFNKSVRHFHISLSFLYKYYIINFLFFQAFLHNN